MKKKTLLIPLLAMSLCLVGCNNQKNETEDKKPDVEEPTPVPTPDPTPEPTPDPTPVVVPTKEEIYAKAFEHDINYHDSGSITYNQYDGYSNQILKPDGTKLTNKEIKDIFNIEAAEFEYSDDLQVRSTYDKENKFYIGREYRTDSKTGKLELSNTPNIIKSINNKLYEFRNDFGGYNINELSADHLDVVSNMSIINSIKNSTKKPLESLEDVKEFIDNKFDWDFNIPVDTEMVANYDNGTYTVLFKFEKENYKAGKSNFKSIKSTSKIIFNKDGVSYLNMGFKAFIDNGERKIGETTYQIVTEGEYNEDYTFNNKINDEIKLTSEEETTFNNLITTKPITKPFSYITIINQFDHKREINGHLDDQLVYIQDFVTESSDKIDYEYYEDKEFTKKVNLEDIKHKSYNKNIYLKMIPKEGYALIHENYSEPYQTNLSIDYYKVIKVTDTTNKYTYKKVSTDEFSKPSLANKPFTSIYNGDKFVLNETEFTIESGKVYDINYKIENLGLFDKD